MAQGESNPFFYFIYRGIPDACSRALSIALYNKEILSIMAVNGTILPKIYANAITRHEQKKKYCPMKHLSVINENKQNKKKLLSYTILGPFCHLHQRKQIKNKFTQLRIYFNVSGQVHDVKKKASIKRGHLIAQVHNAAVKWSIKPCIFRTKKVSKSLRHKWVE